MGRNRMFRTCGSGAAWLMCMCRGTKGQYILDMLERYGQADSTPVKTPMVPGTNLSVSMAPVSSEDKEYMKKVPYISAVGSLLFLALATRPDIAHTVSVLCRFNSNPGVAHWKSVKHLFRYLRGTLDYRLVYGPTDSKELFASFCDADHAGNPDNGRSTSGYVLRIGSGAISWSSKLQGLVAQSTTEAEFIAAIEACNQEGVLFVAVLVDVACVPPYGLIYYLPLQLGAAL